MLDRLLKTLALLAVALVVAFLILWSRAPKITPPLQPVLTPRPPPSLVRQVSSAPQQTVTAPLGAPQGASRPASPYAQKPRDLTVEFELINGVAIAYGDTMLGRPADGQPLPLARGTAEAPLPQYWKNGIVPYVIQPELPNPKRIEDALAFFNQHTSVKFVPYQGQGQDAVIFEKGAEHCYSYLGRVGGVQPVSLAENCGTPEILHELMHALGFVHEQSRTDRDGYVEILWDNIEDKFKSQFAIVPEAMMEAYRGASFDEHSIMMYDPKIFTIKPGLLSMRLISSAPLGAHVALSEQDIHRVNRLYGFE